MGTLHITNTFSLDSFKKKTGADKFTVFTLPASNRKVLDFNGTTAIISKKGFTPSKGTIVELTTKDGIPLYMAMDLQ